MMNGSASLRACRGPLRVGGAAALVLAAACLSPAVADTVKPVRGRALTTELSTSDGLGPPVGRRPEPDAAAPWPGALAGVGPGPAAHADDSAATAAPAVRARGAWSEVAGPWTPSASGLTPWVLQGGLSLLLYVWCRKAKGRKRPRW